MNQKVLTIGAILAALAAFGALSTFTPLNLVQQASADACNQNEFQCRGCEFFNQGYFSSRGSCHHHF